jgi:hypothetical protein
VLLIKPTDVSIELGVLGPDPISIRIDVYEEPWVILELVLDILNYDDSKVLALALSPECITHELKSNILEYRVQ